MLGTGLGEALVLLASESDLVGIASDADGSLIAPFADAWFDPVKQPWSKPPHVHYAFHASASTMHGCSFAQLHVLTIPCAETSVARFQYHLLRLPCCDFTVNSCAIRHLSILGSNTGNLGTPYLQGQLVSLC